MIKLTQHSMVRLAIEKIKEFGQFKSGTYNEADPTHYERGSALFLFGGEHEVTAKFDDYTWGVKFEIRTSDGVAKARFSRSGEDGDWNDIEGNIFRDLQNIILAIEEDRV